MVGGVLDQWSAVVSACRHSLPPHPRFTFVIRDKATRTHTHSHTQQHTNTHTRTHFTSFTHTHSLTSQHYLEDAPDRRGLRGVLRVPRAVARGVVSGRVGPLERAPHASQPALSRAVPVVPSCRRRSRGRGRARSCAIVTFMNECVRTILLPRRDDGESPPGPYQPASRRRALVYASVTCCFTRFVGLRTMRNCRTSPGAAACRGDWYVEHT